MIDPHVHLRDWGQSYKETIAHGLSVAERIGLSGVFDMPNTSPAINSRALLERRLADAEKVNSPVFYGVYAGLTSDPAQIREVVEAYRDFFPKENSRVGVVGLKMFAGHSVGNLGIIEPQDQKIVYETLVDAGYDGVLPVHCEKESLLLPCLWDPANPRSHSFARSHLSEVGSVSDQIKLAEGCGFKGTLHIAHVSAPYSIKLIEAARARGKIKITCGVTPHHCLLDYESIPNSEQGLLFKVNPPLRNSSASFRMFAFLREGKIDWIETDHAPHTLAEKTGKALDAKGQPQYMSGFPGLPFYPHFLEVMRRCYFPSEMIKDLTHNNICKTFGINLPERDVAPVMDLHKEYEVDVYGGPK